MKKLVLVLLIGTAIFFGLKSCGVHAQTSHAIDRVSTAFGQCVGALETRVDEISSLKKEISELQDQLKKSQKPDVKK
ncbi:MAG: hypothetical protein KGJ13_07245 [Patescibacteria group bacterium]|nr:hypothetical protein [Patescibacteria group bacterium]